MCDAGLQVPGKSHSKTAEPPPSSHHCSSPPLAKYSAGGFEFDFRGAAVDSPPSATNSAPPTLGPPGLRHPPAAPPQAAPDGLDPWPWEAGPGPPDPFRDDWTQWRDSGHGVSDDGGCGLPRPWLEDGGCGGSDNAGPARSRVVSAACSTADGAGVALWGAIGGGC
jgi:hypothetical protein